MELMKEVRKEVVRLPENCAASRTYPAHTIRQKVSVLALTCLRKNVLSEISVC